MNKLLALALATTCGAATAQTPAINPMPDGSRDMYVGLGMQSAPRYEGAESSKTSALPVLQVQWSSGIFVSGMSAGMHLGSNPSVEFGPLLTVQPRRTSNGTGAEVGGMGSLSPSLKAIVPVAGLPLAGMDDIHTRLLGGAFLNYYLSPEWRVTSSLLWGAGNARKGGVAALGVQRIAAEVAARHKLSLAAGVTIANRDYNQAFFGVTSYESFRSGHPVYDAGGGLKDVHLGARWNWSLSPSWILTSHVQAARLVGSASRSPLVLRSTKVTVSSAIAYRF